MKQESHSILILGLVGERQHQLGMVAEETGRTQPIPNSLSISIKLFALIEVSDEHGSILHSLARLHQTTQDDRILTTIAETLGGTVEQVQALLAQTGEG